jgi:hypothetical protein
VDIVRVQLERGREKTIAYFDKVLSRLGERTLVRGDAYEEAQLGLRTLRRAGMD